MAISVGVDVGGARKGFDVAVVEEQSLVSLEARCSRDRVVQIVADAGPAAVGIDSPSDCAPRGEKSREGERELARAICPIFFTPDEAAVRSGNPFYGWVVEGLELYASLARVQPKTECVEVFPSAAWTVWAGPRAGRGKAQWSRLALRRAGIEGLPRRCSQDARDAAGAALVAGLFARGRARRFGTIAVPRDGAVALGR